MSTTTIVFVGLLLIIIVGLIYAITANLFGRRHYPPEYQYGYGYPPHYPPPQYHHPDYRRERENSTSSFWAFMILLTIAAVLYLANAVTETGLSTNIPEVKRILEYPTEEGGNEKYSPVSEGDLTGANNDPKLTHHGARLGDFPNPYVEYENGLRKDTIEEEEQRPQARDYRTGYGVQLFATEKDWLSEEAKDKLRRRFGSRPLLQSPVRVNGSLLNRTIIGGFDTEAEALDTRRVLIRDFGKNIRVVKLSELSEISLYE